MHLLPPILSQSELSGKEWTLSALLLAGIIALVGLFTKEVFLIGTTVRRREAEIRADFDRREAQIRADLNAERMENAALRKENRELLVTARSSAEAAQVLSGKVQTQTGAQA